MAEKMTITFDSYHAGCLEGVLRHRLAEAERHKRIAGHLYEADAAKNIDEFIGQLNGCIDAVLRARADFLKPRSERKAS